MAASAPRGLFAIWRLRKPAPPTDALPMAIAAALAPANAERVLFLREQIGRIVRLSPVLPCRRSPAELDRPRREAVPARRERAPPVPQHPPERRSGHTRLSASLSARRARGAEIASGVSCRCRLFPRETSGRMRITLPRSRRNTSSRCRLAVSVDGTEEGTAVAEAAASPHRWPGMICGSASRVPSDSRRLLERHRAAKGVEGEARRPSCPAGRERVGQCIVPPASERSSLPLVSRSRGNDGRLA